MTQADIAILRRLFSGQWKSDLTGRSLVLSLDAADLDDPEVQVVARDLINRMKELVEENARLNTERGIRK